MPATRAVVTGYESSVASIEPEKDFKELCQKIGLACLRIVDYGHECGEQDGSVAIRHRWLVNRIHTSAVTWHI